MSFDIVLISKKNICVKDIPPLITAAYHAINVKNNYSYSQSFEYHTSLMEYEIFVKNSIMSGDLIQRSPITLEPILKPIGNQIIGDYVVTVKDLTEYAAKIGFNIVIKKKIAKVSQAPSPITPVRGSYSIKTNNADRNPRWGKWKLIDEVKLWEGVALSLNIEPEKVRLSGWREAQRRFDEGDTFNDRLEVLRRNSSNRTHFPTACSLSLSNPNESGIRIDEFAAWCVHIKYEIPNELAAMAKDRDYKDTNLVDAVDLDLRILSKVANVNRPITHTLNGAISPWDLADPKDPDPKQHWFTPARYFARQLVIENSTLLNNRNLLAQKTAVSLKSAGIHGRSKSKALEAGTILKAFANIKLS